MGHSDAKRIRDYLRERVESLDDPRQLGKPLQGQLGAVAACAGGLLGKEPGAPGGGQLGPWFASSWSSVLTRA